MDVSGIVRRSPWGLAVVALLGLSGCLAASRGWVREQLAPVQGQLAEVRDRVAVVEQQFGGLASKVDHILAQVEQQRQQSIISYQHPVPSSSRLPESLPVEVSFDLTITGEATPRAGGAAPPHQHHVLARLPRAQATPRAGGAASPRPAPVKALTPTPPGRAAHPDCLLKILKGEPC
jgi:hypothetical protein